MGARLPLRHHPCNRGVIVWPHLPLRAKFSKGESRFQYLQSLASLFIKYHPTVHRDVSFFSTPMWGFSRQSNGKTKDIDVSQHYTSNNVMAMNKNHHRSFFTWFANITGTYTILSWFESIVMKSDNSQQRRTWRRCGDDDRCEEERMIASDGRMRAPDPVYQSLNLLRCRSQERRNGGRTKPSCLSCFTFCFDEEFLNVQIFQYPW